MICKCVVVEGDHGPHHHPVTTLHCACVGPIPMPSRCMASPACAYHAWGAYLMHGIPLCLPCGWDPCLYPAPACAYPVHGVLLGFALFLGGARCSAGALLRRGTLGLRLVRDVSRLLVLLLLRHVQTLRLAQVVHRVLLQQKIRYSCAVHPGLSVAPRPHRLHDA